LLYFLNVLDGTTTARIRPRQNAGHGEKLRHPFGVLPERFLKMNYHSKSQDDGGCQWLA
jgi:hypothetical protein